MIRNSTFRSREILKISIRRNAGRTKRSKKTLSKRYYDWLCYQLPFPLIYLQKRLGWSKDKVITISSAEREITKKDLRQLEKVIPGAVPFKSWLKER